MHVISQRAILDGCREHPTAAGGLKSWLKAAQFASWRSIVEVRRSYPSADAIVVGSGRSVTVFNIAGNRLRLITAIHYNRARIYVLRVLTHAEYDKGSWKDQL